MIQEIEFSSLEEYLASVQQLPEEWEMSPSGIWFRGVNSSSYSLQPGCVWRGIDLELEFSFVLEFILNYRTYHKKEITNPLELYALMQHYGMPTRLLDWTTSALVALYFSLESQSDSKHVVWAMSPVELNLITTGYDTHFVPVPEHSNCFITGWLPVGLANTREHVFPEAPIAIKHPPVNHRIQSQKGHFTLHGSSTLGIEEYFEKANSSCIRKFVLANNELRQPLMEQLYALGFKEDDIYQDLNSLSARIIREQSVLIKT
ncbi:hypothetical protein AKJ18_02510 [Vibrio xuii]|nr:hypothetical protein AKJ18_02510 [Vibrio xuii]